MNMKPHFLFPTSPLNDGMIDEVFQDQALALKQAGFSTSAFNIDTNRIIGEKPKFNSVVVYRGWMMTSAEYEQFYNWLLDDGIHLLTDVAQYELTHYLPNWYDLLRGKTPETRFLDHHLYNDIQAICDEINARGFHKVFVKDFVKSLKTGNKPVFNCPVQANDIKRLLEDMVKYNGKITDGLAIREYEEFVPNSEKRYFIINGRFYSQDFVIGQDFVGEAKITNLLYFVSQKISSFFYSVDVAERTDGSYRVVEIGDGQVSDLIGGWSPNRFAEIWK